MERLQKLISRAGVTSRRDAENLITAGRVTVDGKIITELGFKADTTNKICVDGNPLTFDAEKIYILLNKPRGYVCTAKDERGRKTVIDLVNIPARISPIGRLDLNSEGLLLLTNDGELMNALIHPKFQINKTYIAKVTGAVTEENLDKLRAGIELDDGLTAPAEIFLLDPETVQITIHEGRNRQIRRMFAAIGCDVKKLKRVAFAGLTLDGVKVGKFRYLTRAEIDNLKKNTLNHSG